MITLKKIGLAALAITVLLLGSAILYLGVRPATRPIQDQAGEELPGSIVLLEELEINVLLSTRQGVRVCRYAVRIIPKRCPDVSGISVRMRPKYAIKLVSE